MHKNSFILFSEDSWHFIHWFLGEWNSGDGLRIFGCGSFVDDGTESFGENAVEVFFCFVHFIVLYSCVIRSHYQYHRQLLEELLFVGILHRILLTNLFSRMCQDLTLSVFIYVCPRQLVFIRLSWRFSLRLLFFSLFISLFGFFAARCLIFCGLSFFLLASVILLDRHCT